METSDATTFEAVARAYELLVNEGPRWERERDYLVQLLRASVGSRDMRDAVVLDLGCGTGFHARHLAGCLDIRHVVGVDPSSSMLAVAAGKANGARVIWMHGSAENPPLHPCGSPYDLVLLLGNTFSLIRDVAPVLQAIAGVTRSPGGIFILQMLDYDRLRSLGPQVVDKSNDECRIVKNLVPVRQAEVNDGSPYIGAELSLEVVSMTDNRPLDRQDHRLYEHPERAWAEAAAHAGWSITERRAGYGPDPSVGNDRIFVLKRNG